MSRNIVFTEIAEKNFETLKQYVPVVAKVHGGSHPEFLQVQEIFGKIAEKIEKSGPEKVELKEEFTRLRQVTENYRIPNDTCESYEAVYNMLKEMDEAYGA